MFLRGFMSNLKKMMFSIFMLIMIGTAAHFITELDSKGNSIELSIAVDPIRCTPVCLTNVSKELTSEGFPQIIANGNKVYLIEYLGDFNYRGMINFRTSVNYARGNYKSGDILLINVESPGGSVMTCSNASSSIDNARRTGFTIYTTTDLMAASCGYKLLINSDKVFASKGATVGNIGVVSKYKVTKTPSGVFSVGSTRTKELLSGGFSGSVEDINIVTDLLKDNFNDFKADVLNHRGDLIKEVNFKEVFSGKTFMGYKALNLGLIDKLQDRRATIELLHENGYEVVKVSLKPEK